MIPSRLIAALLLTFAEAAVSDAFAAEPPAARVLVALAQADAVGVESAEAQTKEPGTTAAPPKDPTTDAPASEASAAPEVGTTSDAPVGRTADPAQVEDDASVDRYRTPVEVLTERMIGTASRAVRYDWRKSSVGFGLLGSELLERNNFGSTRVGAMVRRPFGDFMGEIAITRAFTWGTDSTRKLALTPYRQHGRPSRFELDVNVGYPIAEGVATAWPGFFPPTELVFSANAGLRYLFYPGALGGAPFKDVLTSLIAPKLTEYELQKMEADRPGGMQIDSARYSVLTGLQLDVYFQTGGFLSPRVMVAVPLLTPVNGTALGWWWELSLGLGWTL